MRLRGLGSAATLVILLMALLGATTPSWAAAEAEPGWSQLTAAEQVVLKPLHKMWPALDAARKQKWRDIAARYPKMPPEQQQRMSARMVEWAGMTPEQRIAARMRFEESKQLPTAERQALWEAYQALPVDERRSLASKADQRKPAAAAAAAASVANATKPAINTVQPKMNTVASAASHPPARPVAPGTVQANAGASTRPITQRPTPAAHQLPGQAKIAASPDQVNSTTLLPQRIAASGTGEPARAASR
jgi:exonuclease VII large subunit